ncbi:hypothetical protein [Arthrobacter sp. OAP107]
MAVRPTAIFVPQDVSIVGFDDIGGAAWSVIDRTTVRQDLCG